MRAPLVAGRKLDQWAGGALVVVALGFALSSVFRQPTSRGSAIAASAPPQAAASARAVESADSTEPAVGRPAAEPGESSSVAAASVPATAGAAARPEPPAPTDPIAFNGAGFREPVRPEYLDCRAVPRPRTWGGVAVQAAPPDPQSASAKHAAEDQALSQALEAGSAEMALGVTGGE